MLYQLQFFFTNVSKFSPQSISFFYRVIIYNTTIISQISQFQTTLQKELLSKKPYIVKIEDMKLRLLKLPKDDLETKKFKKDLMEGQKDEEDILHDQNLLYIFENIYYKIISYSHNDLLVGYLKIKETRKLVARKYFTSIFYQDVKAYEKGSNVYLAFKIVCHKPYKDFQLFAVPIYYQKNLSIDLIMDFLFLINQKNDKYDLILVIIDYLINMLHYKLVKTTNDIIKLVEVIIDIII